MEQNQSQLLDQQREDRNRLIKQIIGGLMLVSPFLLAFIVVMIGAGWAGIIFTLIVLVTAGWFGVGMYLFFENI